MIKSLPDILRGERVWVNPAHRISSAIFLMRGHVLTGLPVLDGPRLAGMLTAGAMLGVSAGLAVESVMERDLPILTEAMSVREAAEIMTRSRYDALPVVNAQGELLGLLTAADLLLEMRRPADPLTELPWSDTLREWAIECLRSGQEITILFFDVNDFGTFNKQYGHVVGDAVLKSAADVMRDACDAETDSLCRYGGDEFCIATLRHADEAEEMALRIERECARLHIQELQKAAVSVTFGLRGGRRTREREQTHYAATLNNLINLASRDCMLAKTKRSGSLRPDSEANFEPEAAVQTRPVASDNDEAALTDALNPTLNNTEGFVSGPPSVLRLSTLEVSRSSDTTQVRVELETIARPENAGGADGAAQAETAQPLAAYSSTLSRSIAPDAVAHLVAEATLSALNRALPEGYALLLDDVVTHPTGGSRLLITVLGALQTPLDRRPIAETVFAGDDQYRSVALAALAAANRQVHSLVPPITN